MVFKSYKLKQSHVTVFVLYSSRKLRGLLICGIRNAMVRSVPYKLPRIHGISLYAAVAGWPPRGDRVRTGSAPCFTRTALFTTLIFIVIESYPHTTRDPNFNMNARDIRTTISFIKMS